MTTSMSEKAERCGLAKPLGRLLTEALGDEFTSAGTVEGVVVCDLCDDSRKVTPGALFVAVDGSKVRGAAFVNEAASRGAVAIVADGYADVPAGPVLIKVPDARRALARLAAVFHGLDRIQRQGELTAVGITGTNGKSTTAFMIRAILAATGQKAALLGTIEYDLVGRRLSAGLTTPDAITLSRHLVEAHAAGARHLVMEVSSHSLDQRRADGIRFSAAIFTNLTQDHLDYHQTPERYLLAKRRLFEGLERDAVAVVNADDAASASIVEGCAARVVRYGVDRTADVQAQIVASDWFGSRFRVRYEGGELDLYTPMVGRHNVANALAAASAMLTTGVAPEAVRQGLAGLSHVPGRLQPVDTGDLGFSVFVDYAHTDDALRNVLRAVRPLTRGKLWCVFGCGGDRDRSKRPLMAQAVAQGADKLVITSDNPRTEDPLGIIADIEGGLAASDRQRAVTEPDRTCAIGYAVSRLEPGDTLLIAGKGHENYQIIGTDKTHFDDVEVAEGAVRRRTGAG